MKISTLPSQIGIECIVNVGRPVMSVTGDASCAVVGQRAVGKML